MQDELSPRQMSAAQKRFYPFSLLNAISFQLLSGNIIALYALRMEAGNFLMGLLILTGIVSGVGASLIVFRFPEPPRLAPFRSAIPTEATAINSRKTAKASCF